MLLADDWTPVVLLAMTVIAAIIVGCLLLIALFWRLSLKSGGPMGFFWGSLLGVVSANAARLLFGYWSIHDIYTSLLPGAVLAAVLSYLVNLRSQRKNSASQENASVN